MTKQHNHSVAVIGANGQVGTELCVLLREHGLDVRPVVRNRIGASTFEQLGFDYRIGSITDNERAPELLENVDTVVITAFVPWFYGQNPRPARKTNKQIVKNAVRYSPPESTQIYFSTLVAFGSEIGLSNWRWYKREKDRIESEFESYCERYEKEGYVLRLGHVYGPTQGHTRDLISDLSGRDHVSLPVSPSRDSNIVHTVTLSNVVQECAVNQVEPGTYTVVNNPQWTWSEVVQYYLPETTIRFEPQKQINAPGGRLLETVIGRVMSPLRRYEEILISPLHLLPDKISVYLNNIRNSQEIRESIENYEQRTTYRHPHFSYGSVPGPQIGPTTEMDLHEGEHSIRSALIDR